jgi:16S rRNA (cytosine1402-N4)-methyltransferase
MLPNVLQPNSTDHIPVLADEVRELLAVKPGETVVDATFGAGGHAGLLAADLRGSGRFIAIDRDPTVQPYFDRFRRAAGVPARLHRGEAADVLGQLAENDVRVDAILLDLGVSSMQLDRPERGFSYAVDAPLDMRMNPRDELSAREIVNEWSERDLAQIFKRYGEERYGHPARRVFQALRIAVNDELGELEHALAAAFEMLRPGGRLAVISFHSLEDRIVKRFMRERERGCVCPPDFPVCVCGHEPELRALNRRPIRPSTRETAANPRAASARLRVAVRT